MIINSVKNINPVFAGKKLKPSKNKANTRVLGPYMPYMNPYANPLGDVFKRQTQKTADTAQSSQKPAKATHPFRKISFNQAKNMLDPNKTKAVQDFLRQNARNLELSAPASKNPAIEDMFEIGGKKYNAKFSGAGGTKMTFQIEDGRKKFTLALPTYVNKPEYMTEKWLQVLQFEPANTKFLRNKGFKTNGICDIVPVKVAGVEFPAILMHPYSEHPFKVGDRKNYSFENLLSFDEINTLNDSRFLDLYKEIPKEIAKLVSLGIQPSFDCINLCRDKSPTGKDCTGPIRLYFNDLDTNIINKDLTEKEAEEYIETYARLAISALPDSTENNLRMWCDYFVFIESNNYIQEEIKTRALKEYAKLTKK